MAAEWTEELLWCFIEYYQTNFPEDFQRDLEYLEEKYRMMNDEVHNPNLQNTSPSEINETYEPSPRMDLYEQPLCLGSTFVSETLRKSDQMHQTFEESTLAMTLMVKMPECMSWLDKYDEPIGDLDKMEDKVDNLSPQSTLQVLPSFEVNTPPVTHSEEIKETIGILMEVEPLDHMKLEDLGLNTRSHDLFLSSREFPSVDEPKPQPLPNIPFLDVNLGDKRGTDPPINPYSPGSFRMKVVEPLTIHTPPSPHVAYFHQNGRKAHLLEKKQIPSAGVFDEVFGTWMTFGGNTQRGDGIADFKRRRQDSYGDGVKDLVTASERSRPKETIEDSAS
ncbi:hypothetical protein Tco_1407077 [Tanacetum coccineum]